LETKIANIKPEKIEQKKLVYDFEEAVIYQLTDELIQLKKVEAHNL